MEFTNQYETMLFCVTFTMIFQVCCFDFKETVITTCPVSHSSGKAANITIISDGIDFKAVAFCSNGEEHSMIIISPTAKYIPVYFHLDPPSIDACVFNEQWSIPRGTQIKPTPFNHVIVARPSEHRKRKPVICQIECDKKLPKVTPTDIQTLQTIRGTPLEYVISQHVPKVNSTFGFVQLGSLVSYQDLTQPGYFFITVTMYYSIFTGVKNMHCAYVETQGDGMVDTDTANETIFKGPLGVSDISLEVTDIDGNVISQSFETGRYIRLRGSITQLRENETGLQAMNCVAGAQATTRTIPILEGGCGNGKFIKKGKGFVSTGLQTLSAPFKSFALISTGQIYYNCTFTLCTGNASCRGSSCSTNGTVVTSLRKRRSVAFDSINDLSGSHMFRMGMLGYGATGGHIIISSPLDDNKTHKPTVKNKRDKLIGLAITLSIISIVFTMTLIIYLCFRANDSDEL